MKKGKYIKITKIGAQASPLVPTPAAEGYQFGQDNGSVSLPIAYVAEGHLIEDIKVGEQIKLNRTKRNGVEIPGLLTTTRVTGVDAQGRIETQNSMYIVEELPQN